MRGTGVMAEKGDTGEYANLINPFRECRADFGNVIFDSGMLTKINRYSKFSKSTKYD